MTTDPTGRNSGDENAPLLRFPDVEAGLRVDGTVDSRNGRTLLNGHGHGHGHDDSDLEDEFQRTKSVWFLLLLTLGIGGLQIAWSVELSNGSPYLLSLGLSKSLMALVWIAGPLSGTLVQPYVGMLSDRCQVSWGKRKPFMLGGTVATMAALMGLAWTREMVAEPLHWLFGMDPASDGVHTAVIVVAVAWVYVLDFAINMVQASIRAFIVDCAPAHQQEAANSMASRMTGIGNIIGYVAGYANLPRMLWWLGDTQFKDLCAIACVALSSTVVISCLTIRERDPRLEAPSHAAVAAAAAAADGSSSQGLVAFFVHISAAVRRLPPQIRKVCLVQFCAWVGFFPMLFYTSSYIGEIYVEPFLEANPNMTPDELDRLYEEATRVGTFALLVYSITSLCTNVFLPFFIAPTYDSHPLTESENERDGLTTPVSSKKTSWLDYLVIPGFTLRRAWMLSLLLFSGSMSCTVLVTSVRAATIIIGLVGITWALTLWAPWAIISAEISRRDARLRAQRQVNSDATEEEPVDQAGVILGIHNMAIAAPQIFATVGSSIIFRFLQKPRGTPGDHSIAVVMALGGITVLVAVYFVHHLEDEPAELLSVSPEGAIEEHEELIMPHGLIRHLSSEHLSRESQDRAARARGAGYSGGLEY